MARTCNAGFVYTTPGGVLRTHLLRWPLRDVEPVHRRRRFVRESLDMSVRQVVTIGSGVSEIMATIRYEDLPEDLLDMLVHAADGVQIEYWEDIRVSSTATPFLLILDDPSTVHLAMDRDRYRAHGEYEARVRLRRLDGCPPLPINSNLLRNPGFEEGGAWWQPITGASFLCDPAIAHGGSGYVEIFAPAGVARRMDYMAAASNAPRQVWSVQPGDAVTFGAWAQRVSGDGNVRCEVVALDADKGNASFAQGTNITVDEWAYSGRSAYIIPEGKAYIYLACVIPQGGNTTGTVARFDNVSLQIRMAS